VLPLEDLGVKSVVLLDGVDEFCDMDVESSNFGLCSGEAFIEGDRPVTAPLPEKFVNWVCL
jgi:hypothetical protein